MNIEWHVFMAHGVVYWATVYCRNYDNTLSSFNSIPERDRQTDGWTDRQADARTDRQNCYINIARVSVLTREKMQNKNGELNIARSHLTLCGSIFIMDLSALRTIQFLYWNVPVRLGASPYWYSSGRLWPARFAYSQPAGHMDRPADVVMGQTSARTAEWAT